MQAKLVSVENFGEIFDVSRETVDHLRAFVDLLMKWNPSINLVAKSTIPEIWTRHITDSAQLFHHAGASNDATWLDLGSGGGLPGLVIAIMAKENQTPGCVKLIESDARKCAFLRTVARDLNLNVEIIEDRIEAVQPVMADIISARAFASLSVLLGAASRHGKPGAVSLFLKGKNANAELTAARKSWIVDAEIIPSMTDSSARILKIKDVSRASEE